MTTYTEERKIISVPTDTPIFYPDRSGKPMATGDHYRYKHAANTKS